MPVEIRKLVVTREDVDFEGFKSTEKTIRRVTVAAVIKNPMAGRYEENLSPIFDIGEELGDRLCRIGMEELGGAVESYGKACIVGMDGELEHGGAILHPKLGYAMRKAIVLPCRALIPGNKKVGNPGAKIDIPLGFRDEAALRSHYDTIPEAGVFDAPRADELVVIVALTDGGRPHPRIGGKGMADYLARLAQEATTRQEG